jgi:hypothetical protein
MDEKTIETATGKRSPRDLLGLVGEQTPAGLLLEHLLERVEALEANERQREEYEREQWERQ